MVSLLSFLLVIAICVISHEYGHYKTARLAGVQVHEFAFGMGPVIWQTRNLEGTLWSVRIFPIGGFVRLAGMDEEKPGEQIRDNGSFSDKRAIQRFFILFNGALSNIILAIILTALLLSGHGILDLQSTMVGELMSGYPAEKIGLAKGDVITEINGIQVADWPEMSDLIKKVALQENPVEISVSRGKEILRFQVTIPLDKELGVPLLGIRPSFLRFSLAGATVKAFSYIFQMSLEWIKGIYFLLTNRAEVDITGPVGIASMAGQAARSGFWSFLSFLAIINLNLGLINLFPFPGLDGGRLVFVFLEMISGRKVPEKIENYIHFAGFILLIALVIFITWKDILRIFQ
ncbi:MAG: RIP metalloprotease RseP [Synergistales bacterium]|nr:RIP metalloprotease RseP [Synergistales bacterium]